MRTNGNDSKRRTRNDARSGTSTTSISSGYGTTISGGTGSCDEPATQNENGSKSVIDIFDPIDDTITDCPGGVCPVPWAVPSSAEEYKDEVNHPEHYTHGGSVECIEAIESQLTPEEYRGYLKGCIAKYIWREKHKGGIQSLQKAQWYLTRLIALE